MINMSIVKINDKYVNSKDKINDKYVNSKDVYLRWLIYHHMVHISNGKRIMSVSTINKEDPHFHHTFVWASKKLKYISTLFNKLKSK